MFKYHNGITHRHGDYETRYFQMISNTFPECWSSWRAFEATRGVYNIASKYGLLDMLRAELGQRCDFLNPELQSEPTVVILKDIMNTIANNVANGLHEIELQSLLMELVLFCVAVSASSLFF